MPGHETSPTLIDRLRDPADAAAWARFQSTYAELVVRYCLSKGLQTADAEDAWQLALLKLTRALPNFRYDRARGRFRDFLFVVVRSAIADIFRRHGRDVEPVAAFSTDGHVEPISPTAGDEQWESEWRDFHFRRAWKAIEPTFESQSLAAFERLLSGESVKLVADRFAMSEQGLHKIKQRIRDRLAEQIRAQVVEEDGRE